MMQVEGRVLVQPEVAFILPMAKERRQTTPRVLRQLPRSPVFFGKGKELPGVKGMRFTPGGVMPLYGGDEMAKIRGMGSIKAQGAKRHHPTSKPGKLYFGRRQNHPWGSRR